MAYSLLVGGGRQHATFGGVDVSNALIDELGTPVSGLRGLALTCPLSAFGAHNENAHRAHSADLLDLDISLASSCVRAPPCRIRARRIAAPSELPDEAHNLPAIAPLSSVYWGRYARAPARNNVWRFSEYAKFRYNMDLKS